MKWEDIKDRVVADLTERIERDPATQAMLHQDLVACGFNVPTSMKPLNHLNVFAAYIKEMARVVDAWDVRMVVRLREICPTAFPRALQKGPLVAHCDGPEGEWVVEPREAHGLPRAT